MADVRMRMELRPDENGPKLAWDLNADSMVEMIAQGRNICKEHNRRFTPRDVLVWENQENIEARKKAEAEEKKRREAEEKRAAEILLKAKANRDAEIEAAAKRLVAERETKAKKEKAS